MFLIFDTETTGLPSSYDAHHTDLEAWSTARLVQIAWQLHSSDGSLISAEDIIIRPEGFEIPLTSEEIHGISAERALAEGVSLQEALGIFEEALELASFIIAHNIEFDLGVVGSEIVRGELSTSLWNIPTIDTMLISTNYCAISGGRRSEFKWPTLTELHTKLFGEAFVEAHNAAIDVHATAKCFFALITNRVYVLEGTDSNSITYEAPWMVREESEKHQRQAKVRQRRLTISRKADNQHRGLEIALGKRIHRTFEDRYYCGQWKDGKRHGQGTYVYPNGVEYVGEWKEGEMHGQGTMTTIYGKPFYIGEFKDGKQHGHGTSTSELINLKGEVDYEIKYVGEFKDDKRHGQGTYTHSTGRKIVGEWKYGRMDGYVIETYPDGRKYAGEYRDDREHGHGSQTYFDGTKYVGEFKYGRRNGHGSQTYSDGTKYVGEWKDDEKHGNGILTTPNEDELEEKWENGILVHSRVL